MLTRICTTLLSLKSNRKGIAALEYGVLAGVVLAGVVIAGTSLTTPLNTAYTAIGGILTAHD